MDSSSTRILAMPRMRLSTATGCDSSVAVWLSSGRRARTAVTATRSRPTTSASAAARPATGPATAPRAAAAMSAVAMTATAVTTAAGMTGTAAAALVRAPALVLAPQSVPVLHALVPVPVPALSPAPAAPSPSKPQYYCPSNVVLGDPVRPLPADPDLLPSAARCAPSPALQSATINFIQFQDTK